MKKILDYQYSNCSLRTHKDSPPFFSDRIAVDPPAVCRIIIAVIIIVQFQFPIVHLAGPLDGLAEAARTGHGPIGGVIVSRRDRSLCVEDLCDILVEVHAVAVQGSALHEGQGAGGHRFQRIPQQRAEHVPVVQHVLGGYLQIPPVQVPFVAGDRAVLGHFLHVAPSLVIVAALNNRVSIPAGEAHRAVDRIIQIVQSP